jgi:CxxC motif-containing protein (DUF1111 family)
MNARRIGRLKPGSPTIVAGVVLSGCTAVALTAAWSLGLFHRPAASDPDGDARPPIAADLLADGREQFTRIRHAEGAVDPKVTAHRLFNARSCAECHRQGGVGGAGPNEHNVQLLAGLTFSRVSPSRLVSTGGSTVLHRQSLAAEYADWRDQLIERLAPRLSDLVTSSGGFAVGTSKSKSEPLALGKFGPFEERNTPPLFGMGLIESIPQSAIDENALRQPAHVRGRAPRLKEGGFGRFGWKSNNATLLAFNENACAVELGLTTPGFAPATFRPSEMAPAAVRPGFGSRSHHERREPVMMSAYDVKALTHYVASLPAPRQVIDPEKRHEAAEGERHFNDIGCAVCHTPNLGGVNGLYSDLLLHNVGTRGGASFYGGSPSESGPDPRSFDFVRADEFRTPPLWGVADSGPYLHDGSVSTLEAAIFAHKGQAIHSGERFLHSLTVDERAAIVAFLKSLRAPL